MECPSCHFRNLPGLEDCGRCGALLQAPSEESFLPPRSSASRRLWRGLRRWAHSQRTPTVARSPKRRPVPTDRLGQQLHRIRKFVNPDLTVPWWRHSLLIADLLCFIPGLGHLYMGRHRRGLTFMVAATIVGIFTSYYIVTFWGSWLLGAWCMLAGGSFFALNFEHTEELQWNHFMLALIMTTMAWAFAHPLFVDSNHLWPTLDITLGRPVGPYPSGSTLSFDRRAYDNQPPMIGEVVITRAGMIDVVLGTPHDRVNWDGNQLTVNDTVYPSVRPLSIGRSPPPFTSIVPEGAFLVLPHAVGEVHDGRIFNAQVMPEAIIRRHDILGRYQGNFPLDWMPDNQPHNTTAE